MNFISRIHAHYQNVMAGELIHIPFGLQGKEWEQFKFLAKEKGTPLKDLNITNKMEFEKELKEYKKKNMSVKDLFDDRLSAIINDEPKFYKSFVGVTNEELSKEIDRVTALNERCTAFDDDIVTHSLEYLYKIQDWVRKKRNVR